MGCRRTESIRVLLVLSGAILALTVVLAFSLDAYGKRSRTHAGSAAAGEVAELVSVKRPTEAYRLWKSRGYHGRNVLYIADRWKKIEANEYNIPPLHRPYPLPVYNLPKQREMEFLDDRNFLFMAALNGFTRRIDAILSPEGFAEMRAQAATARNAAIGGGRIAVSHQGFPRTIYLPEAYRPPAEPVLLFVGASIFTGITPSELAATLLRSGVKVDFAILCSEEGNPHVSASARDQLAVFAELLRNGRPSSASGIGRGK